jgi:hypothetical protein
MQIPFCSSHIRTVTVALSFAMLVGCTGSGPEQPSDQTLSAFPGQTLSRAEQSAATCFNSGCHNVQTSASGTGLTIAAEWQASPHRTAAACVNCHKVGTTHPSSCDECHGGPNPSDTQWKNGATPPDILLTSDSSTTVCIDCHSDTSAQWQADTSHPERANSRGRHYPASGAIMDASYTAAEHAPAGQLTGNCRECHNPHGAKVSSEHSNWMATTAVTGAEGSIIKGHAKQDSLAWANPNLAYQARTDCVRCHTATGFIHYVAPGASFSDTTPFTMDDAKRRQILSCNTCHNNASGRAYGFTVRSVPAVAVPFNFDGFSAATYQVADLGNSNVCIPCHSGLIRGESIKTANPATLAFQFHQSPNPASAAGILTQVAGIGYQYDLAGSYRTPHGHTGSESQYNHTRGPCLSCHTSNHTFRVFSYNGDGTVKGVNSTICSSCHIGNALPMAVADAESYRSGYNAALAALKILLEKNSGGVIKTTGWSNINNAGAWFNYKLLAADLGGYAHNPSYVKLLIYDSIDWMDDGVLNRSVATTVGAASAAGKYLLKNGTRP